jgi:hypothetical protein
MMPVGRVGKGGRGIAAVARLGSAFAHAVCGRNMESADSVGKGGTPAVHRLKLLDRLCPPYN